MTRGVALQDQQIKAGAASDSSSVARAAAALHAIVSERGVPVMPDDAMMHHPRDA
jgi:hypothetical protein